MTHRNLLKTFLWIALGMVCFGTASTTTSASEPILIPLDPPQIFVPTTNLHFLSLDSFADKLPDGDRVNLVIEASDLPDDQIELQLRTAPGMWFKGVESHANGGVVKLEAENGETTGVLTLRRDEFANTTLILVKAKTFGIHTPMYELPAGALAPLLGNRVVFDWIAD